MPVAGLFLALPGLDRFDGRAMTLLAASGIAAIVFLIVFAIRWVASYPKLPDPGPETTDLGPETPALANLLVHRCHVSRTALAATLLDLAARRILGIDMLSREQFVVRLRDAPGSDLAPYEQQMLELVRTRATGGSAPVEVLSLGEAGDADRFWKRFRMSVEKEAREKGFVQGRWKRADFVVLGVLLAIPLALLALALGEAGISEKSATNPDGIAREDWLYFAGGAWAALMFGMTRLRNLRHTPRGREATAHWLGVRQAFRKSNAFEDEPPASVVIWERNLSYAAALGIAHEAVQRLPFEIEDKDTAWSRYGGHWRELEVNYPSRFGHGQVPWKVALEGVGRAIFWGGILFVALPVILRVVYDAAQDLPDGTAEDRNLRLIVGGIVLFVAVAGVYLLARFLGGVIRLWRGLADMGQPNVLEGQVVKIYQGRVAVDNGKDDEITAWAPLVGQHGLSRGDHVRVTHTPRLWYIRNIEVLAGAGSAPEPAESAVSG